jgi:hypothetical protein
MELRHRPDLLARIDPTFRQPKAQTSPGSQARPQELLGVAPAAEVTWFSERARALLGPQAAAIDAPIPRFHIRGAIFDAEA